MAVHQFWKVSGLTPYRGRVLELSEFHLLFGTTRVDAAATLAASVAPSSGGLAGLSDDDVNTQVRWDRADGLELVWDFGGGPLDVSDIRVGAPAAAVADTFLLHATLYYSDDGAAWVVACRYFGISWPGAKTKTASRMGLPQTPLNDLVQVLVPFEEADGVVRNRALRARAMANGAAGPLAISSTQAKFGTRAGATVAPLLFSSAVLDYPGGDYTMEAWVYYTGGVTTAFRHIMQLGNIATSRANIGVWNGRPVMYVEGNSPAGSINPGTSAALMPANTWCHVALVRSGTTYTLFLDGVSIYSITSSVAISTFAGGSFAIGTQQFGGSGNDFFAGFIDDVRLTYAAVYTAPFAPPTASHAEAVSTIVLNPIRGAVRSTEPDLPRIPTVGLAVPFQGASLVALKSRARPNYVFDPLARGRVRGNVLLFSGITNVPVSRRVSLVRERDMLIVMQQWSDRVTGAYDFQYIEETDAYSVIVHDYTHDKRGVIADGLTLANGKVELMP